MTDDAVESILKIHKKYRSQNNICGYAFLRAFPDGKVNGKKFDVDEKIGSYIDVRVNGDDTGADKAEVFKTHCLKEFPFPEYPNEKFLGEDLVWVRMARKYEMVHMLGEIRHNQMMSYYYNADVFVMPSLRETGGTVLIEAMAYGLPII